MVKTCSVFLLLFSAATVCVNAFSMSGFRRFASMFVPSFRDSNSDRDPTLIDPLLPFVSTPDRNAKTNVYLTANCESFIDRLRDYLTDYGAFGTVLDPAVLCPKDSSVWSNECHRLYSLKNVAFSFIKYGSSNEKICHILGSASGLEGSAIKENRICPFCQFSMEYIGEMIRVDPTVSEELLISGVDILCESVFGSESKDCRTMRQKVPKFVQSYKENPFTTIPLNNCIKSKLCPATVKEITRSEASSPIAIPETDASIGEKSGNTNCDLCKNVVAMVEKALEKDEETYEMIAQSIEVMCSYMPKDSRCHVLVEKLNQIVEWIREGSVPLHICIQIDFCPLAMVPKAEPQNLNHFSSEMKWKTSEVDTVDDPALNNTVSCVFCEYAADAIQAAVLYDRYALPMLQQGIASLCNYLPPFFECSELLQNFDKLVDMFDKNKEPQEACQAINMCTPDAMRIIKDLVRTTKSNHGSAADMVGDIQTVIAEVLSMKEEKKEFRRH